MTRLALGLALLIVGCGRPDAGLDFPDDICEGQSCSGHGTCVASGELPTCSCDAGHHAEGLTCVEDGTTGPCNDITCSGHGVCTDAAGEAACLCETGYHAEQLSCVKDGTTGPCANVDCGSGVCVANGSSASCKCDAGYHPEGLTCKPDCTAWPGTLDVPRVMIGGTVTVGGGPLAYGASLRFVETTTNESFTVGVDASGAIQYSAGSIPIAPGNYRIYYSKRSGGGWASEPWNNDRPLGTYDLTTSKQLALDVPRVMIGGTVTVGGGPLAYGASLRFVETTTNESFSVGVDATGVIQYSKRSGGGWASEPWNTDRPLGTYDLSTSKQLALDVPRVYIGGTVTVGAGPLAYGASLRFVETTTNESFSVGVDATGAIQYSAGSIPIAPGTYRIYYSKRSGGGWASEPWNTDRLLGTYDLTTSKQLALDVPRTTFTGAVTVASGPLAYGASLSFANAEAESDVFNVGVDATGAIQYNAGPVSIAPGSYRVFYSKRSGGGWASEPWNNARPLGCYVIP